MMKSDLYLKLDLYQRIGTKNLKKMSRDIYVKGFHGVNISYDDLDELLNGKYHLNIPKEKLEDCKTVDDIFELPMSFNVRFAIHSDLYELWNTKRDKILREGRIERWTISKQYHSKKLREIIKPKDICPKCGNNINKKDKYCMYCGMKI